MQCARAGRLGLPGVRAFVTVSVAPANTQRISVVQPQHARRRDQTDGSQPRGNKVENIIHTSGKLAEILIFVVVVAHHRVERVDRLIQQPQRRAADQQKYERRDHAVGRVFCNCLNCRLDDTRLVEFSSVAANVHGDRLASFLNRLPQRAVHMLSRVGKAFARQNQPAQQRLRRKTQPEIVSAQPPQREKTARRS